MSKFITIDGLDGSGKGTQAQLLCDALRAMGKKVRMIDFPCYESESSTLVKMYLDGKLGNSPADTNAYAASMFYAADRYVSYVTDWKKDYLDKDTYLIANRYTTANAVHQVSKLPKEEWEGFLSWLWDFELGKLGLPTPDCIVYLEVAPHISLGLVKKRSEATGQKMDIHEKDPAYMERCYEAALYVSDRLGWERIRCYDESGILSREAIHDQILKKALAL